MTETKKKNEQPFDYKRTKKEQVGDFFYETSRKLFWKKGKNPVTNMGIKRGNQIFIIAMLVVLFLPSIFPCVYLLLYGVCTF